MARYFSYFVLTLMLCSTAIFSIEMSGFSAADLAPPRKDDRRQELCLKISVFLSDKLHPISDPKNQQAHLDHIFDALDPAEKIAISARINGLTEKRVWKLGDAETLAVMEEIIQSLHDSDRAANLVKTSRIGVVLGNLTVSSVMLYAIFLGVDPQVALSVSGLAWAVGGTAHFGLYRFNKENLKEREARIAFINQVFAEEGHNKTGVFSAEFTSGENFRRFDFFVRKNEKGELEGTVVSGVMTKDHYENDPNLISLEDLGNVYVAHRQNISDPDTLFSLKLADVRKNRKPALALDFTLSHDEELAKENIVNADTDPAITKKDYSALSVSEKNKYIFEPYVERLLKNLKDPKASKLIHIDHHQDIPVLARTSTTVLVLDLIDYIHKATKEGSLSEKDSKLLMKTLRSSERIVDHSDADILLAHFATLKSNNPEFLAKYSDLLKGTVLLNDYRIRVAKGTDPLLQAKIDIFYHAITSIEERLKTMRLTLGFAMSEIQTLLKQMDKIQASDFKPNGNRLQSDPSFQYFQTHRNNPRTNFLINRFLDGYTEYGKQLEYLDDHFSKQRIDALSEPPKKIEPGQIIKVGRTLIFCTDPKQAVPNLSTTYDFLTEHRPDLIKGIDVIAQIHSFPGDKPLRAIKLRVINPKVDLNKVYDAMAKNHPGAMEGGRASAGTASGGKSGLEISDKDLLEQLKTVLETLQRL